MRKLFLLLLFLLPLAHALAIEPEEQLKDPALEARARALSRELRCLVCENESIDASRAELAGDLRKLVRQRISAGDSDDEIRDLLVARYGDYILFRPRFIPENALLWLGPFAVLALAGLILFWRARKPAPTVPAPLSAEEERELEAVVLGKKQDASPSSQSTGKPAARVTKN